MPGAFTLISSEIDGDIALGLTAADQHIAVRWRLDRVGPVADRPGHKPGLASMADARSAGPSDRDVAGFSKLEHAPERRVPTSTEAASRERDQRPDRKSTRLNSSH